MLMHEDLSIFNEPDESASRVVSLRTAIAASGACGLLTFGGLAFQFATANESAGGLHSATNQLILSAVAGLSLFVLLRIFNAVVAQRLQWAVLISLLVHLLVCIGLHLVRLPGRHGTDQAASAPAERRQERAIADYGDVRVQPTPQPWQRPTEVSTEAADASAVARSTTSSPAHRSDNSSSSTAAVQPAELSAASQPDASRPEVADLTQSDTARRSTAAAARSPSRVPEAEPLAGTPAPESVTVELSNPPDGRTEQASLPSERTRDLSSREPNLTVEQTPTAAAQPLTDHSRPELSRPETASATARIPTLAQTSASTADPSVTQSAVPQRTEVELRPPSDQPITRQAATELPNAQRASRTTPQLESRLTASNLTPSAAANVQSTLSPERLSSPSERSMTSHYPIATRSDSAAMTSEPMRPTTAVAEATPSEAVSANPVARQSAAASPDSFQAPHRGGRSALSVPTVRSGSDDAQKSSATGLAANLPSVDGADVGRVHRSTGPAAAAGLTVAGLRGGGDSGTGRGGASSNRGNSLLAGPATDSGRRSTSLPQSAAGGRQQSASGSTQSAAFGLTQSPGSSSPTPANGSRLSQRAALPSNLNGASRGTGGPGDARTGRDGIARALGRASTAVGSLSVSGPQEGAGAGNGAADLARSGSGIDPNGAAQTVSGDGIAGSNGGGNPAIAGRGTTSNPAGIGSHASLLASGSNVGLPRRAASGLPGRASTTVNRSASSPSMAVAATQSSLPSAGPTSSSPQIRLADRQTGRPDRMREMPVRPKPSNSIPIAFSARTPEARREAVQRLGGTEQSEAAVERGLQWLAAHQFAAGHWSIHELSCDHEQCIGLGTYPADTAATGLALLSFLGAGQTHLEGQYQSEVGRGLTWLTQQQQANGSIAGPPSEFAQFYSHGIATIALCEAYGMSQDAKLHQAAQRAVDFIVQSQHPNLGGWRYQPNQESDTSVSGWQLMALRSAQMAGLKVPTKTFAAVGDWLDVVEDETLPGRFRYHPTRPVTEAMTAEGLLMRQYLGTPATDASLQQGAAWLVQRLPRTDAPNAYYWYYATQVMFHLQGPHWETWNATTRDLLVNTQQPEGPAAGSWDPERPVKDAWGRSGGRLYVTCLHLLMLEVYYRHLPLYDDLDRQDVLSRSSR